MYICSLKILFPGIINYNDYSTTQGLHAKHNDIQPHCGPLRYFHTLPLSSAVETTDNTLLMEARIIEDGTRW